MLEELSRDELLVIEAATGPLGTDAVGREEAAVPVAGGAMLKGTLARPLTGEPVPGILIRTPYGRSEMSAPAAYLASHGYAVLVQDTRSSTSYFFEAQDGRSAVEWIEEQAWFDGNLLLAGFSYLGFAAWATASTLPSSLRAMAIAEYSSDRVTAWYPGGAFTLDQALTWSVGNEPGGSDISSSPLDFSHLPLGDADTAATGETLPFFRERLEFGPDSQHWKSLDFSALAESIAVPVLLFDGWYDYQRIPIFQDFERVGRAGAPRRLVFGPWTHNPLDMRKFLAETRAWFDLHARDKGEPAPEASLFDTGTNGWVDFDRWPDNLSTTTLYATSYFRLAGESVAEPTCVGWTYDPLHPTPSIGLTAFGGLDVGGPHDNRPLFDRSDVVVFTSELLTAELRTAGRVSARATLRSDAPSTDLFIRILDVSPSGVALNVCEAIRRVSSRDLPGSAAYSLEIDLGPIAHTFVAGHAVAVLIASGAFPYYDRNLGYGDPPSTGARTRIANNTVEVGGVGGLSITFSIAASEDEGASVRGQAV
ncbi:CocE/NonD family hydrolase [Diaminobutyricibacter sp. McL0618]|uniref:CocE/NonD family hydrolase n=1 Tax=Leifsonia sp. McL0618 TaxID=3415677 RepID=UPI003CE6D50A